jgi:hypothetical protein
MEERVYYGAITPQDFANALNAYFNRGNYRVQQIGSGPKMMLQIGTRESARSGGKTAIGISLQSLDKGVIVQVGRQALWDVAASLGITALSLLRNPWLLLERIDDLAQDIQSLQLSEAVWEVIEKTAHLHNAGRQIADALSQVVCEYCRTPNKTGEAHCIACGAPLPLPKLPS